MTNMRSTGVLPPGITRRRLKRPRLGRNGRMIETVFDVVVSLKIDEGGKYPKKWTRGLESISEAKAVRARLLVEKDEGRIVRPRKQTVESFLTEWIETVKPQIRQSTWESYESHVRLYLIPKLGRFQMQRVAAADVKSLHAVLIGRGMSASTVRRVHATLHRALGDAVAEGRIAANPASLKHKSLPRVERYQARTWEATQVRAFLDHVRSDRLFALWYSIALLGLRRGEALGLSWGPEGVDLDAGSVSIRRTLIAVHHQVMWSEPKSSLGERGIELDAETLLVLKAHRVRQSEERLAAGPAWREGDLCFADEIGAPLHPDRVAKRFVQHAVAAGLPRIRLHDLRHTWATLAMKNGVPLKVVQERLGHHDPGFTARQYQHVTQGMQREASERVSGVIWGTS